jgi:hypothetical protein
MMSCLYATTRMCSTHSWHGRCACLWTHAGQTTPTSRHTYCCRCVTDHYGCDGYTYNQLCRPQVTVVTAAVAQRCPEWRARRNECCCEMLIVGSCVTSVSVRHQSGSHHKPPAAQHASVLRSDRTGADCASLHAADLCAPRRTCRGCRLPSATMSQTHAPPWTTACVWHRYVVSAHAEGQCTAVPGGFGSGLAAPVVVPQP